MHLRRQWENKKMNQICFLIHNPLFKFFTKYKILLQRFKTMSVTSVMHEYTFLTLNRLKTYLRSTLSEKRLNGLLLANIEKKKELLGEVKVFKLFF